MEAPECPASEWPHCLGRDEPVVGTDPPTQFPSFAHLGGLVTTCSPYTSREKLKCPFALRKKKKKRPELQFLLLLGVCALPITASLVQVCCFFSPELSRQPLTCLPDALPDSASDGPLHRP